jgi:hypothetical protein
MIVYTEKIDNAIRTMVDVFDAKVSKIKAIRLRDKFSSLREDVALSTIEWIIENEDKFPQISKVNQILSQLNQNRKNYKTNQEYDPGHITCFYCDDTGKVPAVFLNEEKNGVKTGVVCACKCSFKNEKSALGSFDDARHIITYLEDKARLYGCNMWQAVGQASNELLGTLRGAKGVFKLKYENDESSN